MMNLPYSLLSLCLTSCFLHMRHDPMEFLWGHDTTWILPEIYCWADSASLNWGPWTWAIHLEGRVAISCFSSLGPKCNLIYEMFQAVLRHMYLVQTMHGEFHFSSAGKNRVGTSTWPRRLLVSALLKLGETDACLSAILLSPGQSFWLAHILMSCEVQPKLLSMHTYVTLNFCALTCAKYSLIINKICWRFMCFSLVQWATFAQGFASNITIMCLLDSTVLHNI